MLPKLVPVPVLLPYEKKGPSLIVRATFGLEKITGTYHYYRFLYSKMYYPKIIRTCGHCWQKCPHDTILYCIPGGTVPVDLHAGLWPVDPH